MFLLLGKLLHHGSDGIQLITRSVAPNLCVPMPPKTELLGVCPECEAKIRSSQILIEYEQADGSTGRFADCFACDEVVKPE